MILLFKLPSAREAERPIKHVEDQLNPTDSMRKSVMQGYEEEDSAFWDDRYRERQKRLADPDEVFFAARDRKQEIKEQIKQLRARLARQHPKLPRLKDKNTPDA